MTLTDLQKLVSTDEGQERIRVMVAELSEARCVTEDGGAFWTYITKDRRAFGDPLEDLNACAEFEAGLSKYGSVEFEGSIFTSEADLYLYNLSRVVFEYADYQWPAFGLDSRAVFALISARALHRCMAFILTKQPTKGAE